MCHSETRADPVPVREPIKCTITTRINSYVYAYVVEKCCFRYVLEDGTVVASASDS